MGGLGERTLATTVAPTVSKTAYKRMHVTSHRKGTVVLLSKPQKTTCTYTRWGRSHTSTMDFSYKAFFDANNNGALDRGDQLFTSSHFCKRCPPGTRRKPIIEGIGFCMQSVTARDVRTFSSLVEKEFMKAKMLRHSITAHLINRFRARSSPLSVRIGGEVYVMRVDRTGSASKAEPDLFGTIGAFGLSNNPRWPDVILSQGCNSRLMSCKTNYGFLDF